MAEADRVTKEFLQSMPIWQYYDEVKAQFDHVKYEWQRYSEILDQITARTNKLPNINLILRSTPATNDRDIVRLYDPKESSHAQSSDKNDKSNKPKSVLMLEEKVKANDDVYALITPNQPWVMCKINSIFRKPLRNLTSKPVIIFRVKAPPEFDSRVIDVDKYAVARIQEHGDSLKPPKRVIAGVRKTAMYAGIIGQEPFEGNRFRYLVHMDDGSARYFRPDQVYPILGQSACPWKDSRHLRAENVNNERYLRLFYNEYPMRRLIKIKAGDEVSMWRDDAEQCQQAMVIETDCDVARIIYQDGKEEFVFRGSPRWIADKVEKAKQLKHMDVESRDKSLLWYRHAYHEAGVIAIDEEKYKFCDDFDRRITISSNNQSARKSCTTRSEPKRIRVNLDGQRVDDDRNNIADGETGDSHKCSPECLDIPGVKTEIHVQDMREEFRNESDLKVPLLLGWKRGLHTVQPTTRNGKSKVLVKYESPCGKIFSQIYLVRRYLLNTGSKMDIDYFTFDRDVELNTLNGSFEAHYYVENMAVDSKTGKPLENKNISLMNPHSEERLPSDFEYRNVSFPHPMLESKGFSFNREFKSSCDCEDDCYMRSTCSCHNLNEEFFGKKAHNKGAVEKQCQYTHKRLVTQVATGIFECNSNCKCSSKCSNRVVQNGIRFRLQVRKTLNKGWGVITLDDIPAGAFICTYAAELLDDADQYGDSDMYYADLDYISVNEEAKELYSDSDEGVEVEVVSEDEAPSLNGKRKNAPRVQGSDNSDECDSKKDNDNDSSLSSSDDENVKYMPQKAGSEKRNRYPKRKVSSQAPKAPPAPANGTRDRERVKFKKIHDLLGTHDFTLDARMQGNVGRFFNHSCDPNAYAQNVFHETHDLRFPIVAFFASKTIKALGEITWNYNYKMGSIKGRRIDCFCAASNCRGRIL